MHKMSSYERVMNRLEGKPVDKIPNMNIVMDFAAKTIGATYREFCTDYRILVESKLKCCEMFGIDTVSAISDPMREASGFGADVIIPENDVPYCKEYLITNLMQVRDLNVIDPLQNERMLDRIKAIELFKKHVKGKIPIVGWVEGTLAEASDLRDISSVMLDLMLEPERIVELFEIIYQQQKLFAKLQIEAGADIIGIGNAAASLIGPKLYEQFCLKYDASIIQYIHSLGAKAKLHICGNTEPILHLISKTNADIFDVDHVVDFCTAIEVFKGTRTVVNGNLDPVVDLLQADEEHVVKAVKSRLEVSDERTLISGGCEIPGKTPHSNMKIMDKSLYI